MAMTTGEESSAGSARRAARAVSMSSLKRAAERVTGSMKRRIDRKEPRTPEVDDLTRLERRVAREGLKRSAERVSPSHRRGVGVVVSWNERDIIGMEPALEEELRQHLELRHRAGLGQVSGEDVVLGSSGAQSRWRGGPWRGGPPRRGDARGSRSRTSNAWRSVRSRRCMSVRWAMSMIRLQLTVQLHASCTRCSSRRPRACNIHANSRLFGLGKRPTTSRPTSNAMRSAHSIALAAASSVPTPRAPALQPAK